VLVPALLFAAAAWHDRAALFRQAFDGARSTVATLHEHALKVLETHELLIEDVDDRIRGLSWDAIQNQPEIHDYLAALVAAHPQAAAAWVADAAGNLRASSRTDPRTRPLNLAKRDYFAAQVARDTGTFIGARVTGVVSGKPSFNVSRRRSAPAGGFDGVINISIQPDYLLDFWQAAASAAGENAVSLLRADGAVLVRYPAVADAPTQLAPNANFFRLIQGHDAGVVRQSSDVDGVDRILAFRKLQAYPVYLLFGLATESVERQWHENLALYGLSAALGAFALAAMSLLAIRQARFAALAAARLAAAADRLRQEITTREAAEAGLRQAQKMEAVGQLTGGVAHDFNNLLTVITGNLGLIMSRPGDAGRVMRMAESAMKACARGERLTQQLLAFTRQQVLRPEVVNTNKLLLDFEPMARRAVGEAVEIAFALDPQLDPVRVDPAQFEAAVLNLLVNARDALVGRTGRITIESRNVAIDAGDASGLEPGSYVLVAVSDSGAGMDAATAARAFDPFFTTKDVGKGSGLGLSQVYGFARSAGGQVKIRSAPERGTTVTLYLPRSADRPRAADTSPQTEMLRPAADGETVLVVEDDEEVRAIAVENLTELGYAVLTAVDGAAALERLGAPGRIDILFSDVVMPGGMNGAQLALAAQRVRPGLKVLLTSGYTAAALTSEHGLPEEVPLLGKPYRREELASKLRLVLGGR
jgi:signal transduction histidine kinase